MSKKISIKIEVSEMEQNSFEYKKQKTCIGCEHLIIQGETGIDDYDENKKCVMFPAMENMVRCICFSGRV